VGSWTFYRDMLLMSLVLYFGGLAVALTFVLTVPRLLARGLREGVVYRLYGWRYFLERLLTALTNVGLFLNLFGDSSLIVHYLRVLGYDVSRPIEQTGSNFGAEVKHDSPYLCTIGRGTMVSDGLSMLNTEYSDSSFRLSRTTIGAHSFFGNGVVYPPNAKVGDDCLFATKTMVPVDGEVRQGVGLLGSPAFEIPRAVRRDASFDDLASEEELPRRLSAKLRHNVTSMAIYLSLRWFHVFLTLLLLGAAGQAYSTGAGALAVAVASVVLLFFTIGYFVLAERAAQGFRPLEPLFCSIYDPRFWRHERFWKMIAPPIVMAFSGTPYKNVVMRLAGVRVGRRVFDDGCFLPEKTLVSIGDDCTLNVGTIVQCHSMEEGAFKLGGISIEHGVTLGVGAYVHYSVVMRAGSVLETDSFLMKGTEVETGTRWGGNPANLMPQGAIAAGMPPEPQPIARRRGRHRTPRHR
jgi:non-ribosomal peptide synthetase-like protein